MALLAEQQPVAAPPEQQGETAEPQMLSDDQEQDIDIIVSMAMEMLESPPEGTPPVEEVLDKLLSQKAPAQQLAMFLAMLMEGIHKQARDGEVDIDPIVWFANGGALEEIIAELEQIVDADIASMYPEIKQHLSKILEQRSAQLKGGDQPPAEAPQQPQQPPQQPPQGALMAGV